MRAEHRSRATENGFWLTTLQAVVVFQHRRLDVRLARLAAQHRHQRVGLVDAGARARPAADEYLNERPNMRDAVGEQRRGQRIARMASEIVAVEAASGWLRDAVDQPAAPRALLRAAPSTMGGAARVDAGVSALRRSCGLP